MRIVIVRVSGILAVLLILLAATGAVSAFAPPTLTR